MKNQTQKPWLNRLRMVLGAAALSVLSACGGGEGASGPSIPTTNITSIKQEVIVPVAAIGARDAVISASSTNTVSITGSSFDLNGYKEGQIVNIPIGSDNFPFGYTGKIISNSRNGGKNTIEMTAATIPDVFKKLSIDFDSIRDNGRITGVITPSYKNGELVFYKNNDVTQAGLSKLRSTDTGFQGELSIKMPMPMPSNNKIALQFTGEIKNLIVKKKLVYEASDNSPIYGAGAIQPIQPIQPSPKALSYKEVSSKITGELAGSIKVVYENTAGPGYTGECQPADVFCYQNKLGLLQGLDEKDKIGMIPLAGLIIQPGYIQPIISQTQVLAAGDNVGLIIWLYLNLNGTIEAKGEFTPLEFKTSFSHDLSLQPNGSDELESNIAIPPPSGNTLKTIIGGSVNITQNIGVTVAADLFVAGIRPLTVQVSPLLAEFNAAIAGSGAYDWIGKQWSGSICVEKYTTKVTSKIFAKSALGVKIKDWLSFGGVWQKTISSEPFAQSGFDSPLCLASGGLDMIVTPDTINSKKYLLDISNTFKDLELPTDAKFLSGKEPSIDWTIEIFRQGEASPIFSDQGKYLTISGDFTNAQGYSKIPKISVTFPDSGVYKVKLNTNARAFNLDSKFVEKLITVNVSPTSTSKLTFQKNSYQLFNMPMSWTAAKSYCESNGAHLATITSQAENDFIISNLQLPNVMGVWLGGTDAVKEGEWRWITGESWSYSNWNTGEPNNSGNGGEHSLSFWMGTAKWNDLFDTAVAYPFICEWEGTTTPASRYAKVGNYDITECVKDTQTGLIWEGKTASGLRAGTNTYTNYDSNYGTATQINASTNSIGYMNAVNATTLCGFNGGWRMPTKDELLTLVKTGVGSPTIDTAWFPNTPASVVWSGSPLANDTSYAWNVSFSLGYSYNDYRSFNYGVRLVRGGQ